MKVVAFLILCAVTLGSVISGLPDVTTQDLRHPWVIMNHNKTIRVYGTAPGDIYSTLWKAKVIEDPRFRYNDMRYRWVSYDNWTFTIFTDVSNDVLSKKVKYLEFEGIDAVSDVYLNGQLIGSTNSAYITYRFDVPNIQARKNNLTVAFTSPVLYAKQQSNKYPYLVPPACPPPTYKGECHYNFIRSFATNFAWDWGPAFPSMGFWRPVKLVGFNNGRIIGAKYSISENSDSSWSVSVDVNVESSTSQKLCVAIEIAELSASASGCWAFPAKKSTSVKTIKLSDKLKNVKLWWPNGYGQQKLYKCDVKLSFGGHVVDTKSQNIGFRTVELIQDPVSHTLPGFTFYFRVNHVNVFIKGSNWIPLDNFLPTMTNDQYEYFFKSAKAANINMMRAWGGGLYEYEWLYEWADQLGILIWQDMMFACAMYPTNNEFLGIIQVEIQQQIWRLQHHPSIALWSGSNENELVVGSGWYNAGGMNPLYVRDYRTLYMDVVKQTIYDVDPNRIFVMSSPTNGRLSEMEGGVSPNPADVRFGDVHFYTYSGDMWNANLYPITRFTSEFGFQSLPSLATWETATNVTQEMVPDGAFMVYREHHTSGIGPIFTITLQYFKPPLRVHDVRANYTRWSYLSQANQAMIYKTEVEKLRRHQCVLDASSQGLSMGAMYWMLNDIWQAPTWSSIEKNGKWKMLHYFVRKFYADTLVSPNINGNKMTLHLGFTPKRPQMTMWVNGTVRTQCFGFNSLTPVGAFDVHISNMIKCPVYEVYEMDVSAVAAKCGCKDPVNCLVVFSFIDSKDIIQAENWILFDAPKNINYNTLKKPNLKISNVRKMSNSFEFSLSIDRPDLFVWLDVINLNGWFSDNGFAMYHGNRTMSFLPFRQDVTTAAEFAKRLTVFSLSDLYMN